MANALSFRRRTNDTYDDVAEEMAARGRSPSTAGYRFRSRPGAPNSAQDSMANLTGGVGERPEAGGLSSGAAWNSFFQRAPAPEVPALPELAPSGTPNPQAMAEYMPKPARTPDQYLQDAVKNSVQWFDTVGAPRPSVSARMPATSGTSFTSKYGSGSVMSGADYRAKLRRMAAASGFDDSMI